MRRSVRAAALSAIVMLAANPGFAQLFPPAGGYPANCTLYSTPGTYQWNLDSSSTIIWGWLYTAGASGASGIVCVSGTQCSGGGGGAAGYCKFFSIPASLVPSAVTVTLPAGGAVSPTVADYATGNGNPGGAGGFGSIIPAFQNGSSSPGAVNAASAGGGAATPHTNASNASGQTAGSGGAVGGSSGASGANGGTSTIYCYPGGAPGTTAAGVAGNGGASALAPTAGGSGAGFAATPVALAGGAGGYIGDSSNLGGTAGTASGGTGAAGQSGLSKGSGGSGAGGGGSSLTGNGGDGGTGGQPGGGGGGGGDTIASDATTQNSVVTGGNTFTVASATGISNNDYVWDLSNRAAIPQGTRVTVSGSTITASGTVTSASGDTLVFSHYLPGRGGKGGDAALLVCQM